jgi:beta-lactamase regulating signal transducer with metallopeptidase domain
MLLSLLVFLGTFLWLLPTAPADGTLLRTASFAPLSTPASTGLHVSDIAAWCWSFGVLFMAVRFARQWRCAHQLKTTAVSEPSQEWKDLFQALKRELGVDKTVRFLQSSIAKTPMVVGWITPVILVPVSTFTALTPAQLKSVLAHELAHIRRHDHILNLFQCLIEAILFFHPITWWISKQIRQEREYCCDDVSILSNSDRRHLAEALTLLESLRLTTPSTLIAANGGSLMNRISRILGTTTNRPATRLGNHSFFSGSLALLLIAAGLSSVGAGCVNNAAEEESSIKTGFTREQYVDRVDAIEQMVTDGEVSREDADLRLRGMRRRIAASRAEQAEEPKTFTRAEYARAKKKMDGMVKAGEASQEDVDARLGHMRRMIVREDSRQTEEPKTFTRAEYAAAKEKMDGMVKAGEASQEDVDTRLGQMRRMITNDGQAKTELNSKSSEDVDWTKIESRIEGAVEAGELTREEADARYIGIKARLDAGGETADRAIARLESTNAEAKSKLKGSDDFDWTETKDRIEAAVEAGELTREEADEKYNGIKARLDAGGETAKRAAARLNYANAEAKIKAMVEAGEVSAEDAEKRLNKMRERIAGDGSEKQSKEAKTFTIEEYKEAAAKIKAMVAEGKVSAEDAEIRLNRMRQATERKTRGPK